MVSAVTLTVTVTVAKTETVTLTLTVTVTVTVPRDLQAAHLLAAAGAVTSMVSAVGFAGATTGNRQFLRTHLAVSLLVMFLLAAASAIALAKADATETLVRHHWHHIQNEARHIVNNM